MNRTTTRIDTMLDKAIKSGKEHRKQYRCTKRFDMTCRNHGSCRYCYINRTAKNAAKSLAADIEIREFNHAE